MEGHKTQQGLTCTAVGSATSAASTVAVASTCPWGDGPCCCCVPLCPEEPGARPSASLAESLFARGAASCAQPSSSCCHGLTWHHLAERHCIRCRRGDEAARARPQRSRAGL